jgi:predicted nucleotidyltransferase
MSLLIEQHRDSIAELCRRFHVKRLELFGSASRDELVPESDLDFLVEFEDLPLQGYADNFFGLMEALSKLFGRNVDLVVESAISNPYFLQAIAASRTLLYAN